MPNEPLKIAHVPLSVSFQIERAPHWTMIRELTMNAIEAASKATGKKLVHWTTGTYKGVRKAVIYNTGPGMSDVELKEATDLNCRINKSLGLDENFGVGAKVSSLPNNKLGMRFRSCKNRKVSEVILGYDEELDLYVRFDRSLPDGKSATVIDVSKVAAQEGRDLSCDWTDVMLLGNAEYQDTAAKPIASLAASEKAYVANSLYRRFYRLPADVQVRVDSVYHRFDTPRTFVPIGERFEKFKRSQSIPVPEFNCTIHFLHDPNIGDRSGLRLSSSGALGSTSTTCCIVHKNEMYSVITGPEWSAAAPRFGIPFGSKELCVHIEIEDNEARPAQYRERLITRENADDIEPIDYSLAVRARMPEWVREVIRSASPSKSEDLSDLRRELQELLNRYKVKVPGRKLDAANGVPSANDAGQHMAAGTPERTGVTSDTSSLKTKRPRRFHEAPEGATATSMYEVYEKAPNPIILVDPELIEEKKLRGRAASFVQETGDLFVNGLYEAVDRSVEDLEPDFVGQAEPEFVRQQVINAAQRTLAFRVGKAVVFALAKRASDDWNDTDMLAALSKESLSIAADNYEESFSAMRKHVRDAIKLEKVAA